MMKLSFKSKTNTLGLASLLVCAVFMLYPENGNKAFAVDCTSDAACGATETCQSYLIATIGNHTTAPIRDTTSCIGAPVSCNWGGFVVGHAKIFDGNSFHGSTDWVNFYNTSEQISNCLARKTSDGSCYSSSTPWLLWNGGGRAYPSNVLNANLGTQNFKDITKNQYTIPYTNMAFITVITRYNGQGATDYGRIVGRLSLARSSSAGVCAPASAKCGSASGATYNIGDIVPSMNLCSVGTPRAFGWNYTAPLESTGTTRSWVCDSSSNTWTNTCTLTVAGANDPPPYVPGNVKCGTANGKSYEVGTTVTDSYCVDGTKIDLQMQGTSFAGAKNYWYCSGGGKATPTCSFAVVGGCYDEVDPDVCKGPYTAGVCYKPGASRGATTLLVKDSKVAINSDDVDRGTTSTTGTTASCETGYTYSGSIDKCVKTICNTHNCSGTNVDYPVSVDRYDQNKSPISGGSTSAPYNKTFLGYWIDNDYELGVPMTSAQARARFEYLISNGNPMGTLILNGISAYKFYIDISADPGTIRCTSCYPRNFEETRQNLTTLQLQFIGQPSGSIGTGSAIGAYYIRTRPAICEDEFADLRQLAESTTCRVDIKDPIRTPTTTDPATLLVVGASGARAAQMLNLSDIRIKTNIEKIDNALAEITKLNGYQFTWKDSGRPDFGVLAQEVEKVFATMVSEDSKGIKAVNYTELLAPIIEAIHEINTRVDELTREAQEQALRIDTLEK